jgi:hypothetical protein
MTFMGAGMTFMRAGMTFMRVGMTPKGMSPEAPAYGKDEYEIASSSLSVRLGERDSSQ